MSANRQIEKSLSLWEKFLREEPKERVQELIDKINAMECDSPTVDEYISSLRKQGLWG